MSRFARVLLLVGVVVASNSAAASAKKPSFYVARVVFPTVLVANGPGKPIVVYWGGQAKFPVTLLAIARSCHRGVVCKPVEYTFPTYRYPLAIDGLRCQGRVPAAGFKLAYTVWLQDSRGAATAKVAEVVSCRRR